MGKLERRQKNLKSIIQSSTFFPSVWMYVYTHVLKKIRIPLYLSSTVARFHVWGV